jgi:hypothetical protein
MFTSSRAVAVAAVGAAVIGFGVPSAVQAASSETTSGLSNAQLTEMREEERMARDLYTQLATSSGEAIFTRIAGAEQRHLDAVERLMTSQGMNPAAVGSTLGRYAVGEVQSAYSRWLSRGRASDQAAFKVGVELETWDIAELKAMEVPSGTSGARVVAALLNGSEHHLTAFTKAVNGDITGAGPGMGMTRGGRGGADDGACPYQGERREGQQGFGPGTSQGRGMGRSG